MLRSSSSPFALVEACNSQTIAGKRFREAPVQWVLDSTLVAYCNACTSTSQGESRITIPQGGRGAGILCRRVLVPSDCRVIQHQFSRGSFRRPGDGPRVKSQVRIHLLWCFLNVSANIAAELNSGPTQLAQGRVGPMFGRNPSHSRVKDPRDYRRKECRLNPVGAHLQRGLIGCPASTTARKPRTIYPLGGPAWFAVGAHLHRQPIIFVVRLPSVSLSSSGPSVSLTRPLDATGSSDTYKIFRYRPPGLDRRTFASLSRHSADIAAVGNSGRETRLLKATSRPNALVGIFIRWALISTRQLIPTSTIELVCPERSSLLGTAY